MRKIKLGDLLPLIKGEFQIYLMNVFHFPELEDKILFSTSSEISEINALSNLAVHKVYPSPYGIGTVIEIWLKERP